MKKKENSFLGTTMIISYIIIMAALSIFFQYVTVISWLYYYEKVYDIFEVLKYVTFAGLLVLSVVFLIRSFQSNYRNLMKTVVALVIVFLNIGIFVDLLYEFGIETSTSSSVMSVSDEKDEAVYMVVNNLSNDEKMKISCNETVHNSLKINDKILYTFTYRYLKSDTAHGVLGDIDICNPVNNAE